MRAPSIDRPHLGSLPEAEHIAQRAASHIAAYQAHTDGLDLEATDWEALPLTDKNNYLLGQPYESLLADNFEDCFAIFSSSGSSGRAFYWPQLREANSDAIERLRQFLEGTFHIHKKKTLSIVGLALGSWIGGEHLSWMLKNVAATSSYPFSLFSPGNLHDEIIDMIHSADRFVDQILLLVCPSAIGHLRLRAEEQGRPLSMNKLRFLVVGEPFPEVLRRELRTVCQCAAPILSVYGSADTGVLGYESPASAGIRSLLSQKPELANAFGFQGAVPHFFHLADQNVFVENISGELCVTKWQGIPLVRYNLHDSARLIEWSCFARAIAEQLPEDRVERQALIDSANTLPDLIAITGRSDSCLLLCGTNLTEAMLDSAIHSVAQTEALTGKYRARCIQDEQRQRLELTLECKPDNDAGNEAQHPHIYSKLIESIGEVQPEFQQDWENIYQRWDGDPNKQILKLQFVIWPELSEAGSIKQRGIVG